jgi:hypothetical protein
MEPDLDKTVDEIHLQTRRLEAVQKNSPNPEGLTELAIFNLPEHC